MKLKVFVVVVLAIALVSSLAQAEPYVGFYLSGVPDWKQDVTSERIFTATGGGDRFRLRNVETGSSVVFGGLLGYQFDSLSWLAAEFDAYHLRPGFESQSVTARSSTAGNTLITIRDGKANMTLLALSAVATHRYLPSTEVPKGRLQAYVGVGPALNLSSVAVTFSSPNATVRIKDQDVSVGPQVKIGGRWFFTPSLAAFAEYRFAHHSLKVSDNGVSNAGNPIRIESNMDPSISLGIVGISWHFGS